MNKTTARVRELNLYRHYFDLVTAGTKTIDKPNCLVRIIGVHGAVRRAASIRIGGRLRCSASSGRAASAAVLGAGSSMPVSSRPASTSALIKVSEEQQQLWP
jgi:hypothetical protein